MNEMQIERINGKLDIIIKLLGAQLIKDQEYRDQVTILHGAGLPNKDIALLTGKTENNIKVTLHLIRKARKK